MQAQREKVGLALLLRAKVDDPYLPGQRSECPDEQHDRDHDDEPHCTNVSGFS